MQGCERRKAGPLPASVLPSVSQFKTMQEVKKMESEQEKLIFDDEPINRPRWIALNDLNQELPKDRLRVKGGIKMKSKSGKEYPVIIAEDKEGNIYYVMAWKRDLRECIQDWGPDPQNWRYINLSIRNGKIEVIVANNQTEEEETIC
jgi:hypothetical protein